jgi:hypothetical protein
MTLETARAILRTSRENAAREPLSGHSIADWVAFEVRLVRLRPRRFVLTTPGGSARAQY